MFRAAKGFESSTRSTGPKGEPVAVSGMLFVSNKPAPAGGRPSSDGRTAPSGWRLVRAVTCEECARDTDDWLNTAMNNGYAVAATDYLGLGTPGPKTYLIGDQEAADVVNSVRALRNFEPAQAGKRWIVGSLAGWPFGIVDRASGEEDRTGT